MEKNYKSNRDFMKEQFPELFTTSLKIEENVSLETLNKKEVLEEKEKSKDICTHEHCILYDNLSIGKGKITLIYRCEKCGEQFLDCKSYLSGMTIQLIHSFSPKVVSYQKLMKKTTKH